MSRQNRIKDFVRNILGCSCPDKVFAQIESRQVAPSFPPHARSITIGGRLLVYIWELEELSKLEENLQVLLEAGKRERDVRGLNRFRAVLAIHDPHLIAHRAQLCFSQYAGKDERIHLHVVPSQAVEDI